METHETMGVRLVRPSMVYKKSYLEAMREAQAEGDEKRFRRFNVNIDELEKDFEGYLKKLADETRGMGMREGYVPATTFWLVEGGEYIGAVTVRHKLSENLLQMGGHIGYGIRPSKKRMGYGTKILQLGLLEAKKLGINKVLVTCDDDNIGSAKIIEKNGGVLENKVEAEGKLKRRYWIENK
jgi:predicted acetyltransferase